MIVKAHDELVRRYHRTLLKGAGLRGRLPADQAAGVNPENKIWIFYTSRSGSTWLRNMMAELKAHKAWDEPSIGHTFHVHIPHTIAL